MKPFRIGVLGGIGPEATVEFYRKLIERLQRQGMIRQNSDYPHIIINSIPAPELIGETVSSGDLKMYVQGLRELDSMGVDIIVMVCNTIHLYLPQLQQEVKTPILNLPAHVQKTLHELGMKSIFILGTMNTISQGLYSFAGYRTLVPSTEELDQLMNCVFLFNQGTDKMKQANNVLKICEKYFEMGAESVLLGCTEFAVMLEGTHFPCINTLDVLVKAVVELYQLRREKID